MATPARSRTQPYSAPGETIVFDDAVTKIRSGGRLTLTKLGAFVRRVVAEEPTLLGELAGWGFVASWSASLLLHRTATLPPAIAESFERGSYYTMAVIGACLAVVQFVAMVSLMEKPRAACAFCTSVWLGGLAGSLFFGDGRVPTGFGYLVLSFLSMCAFWRVYPRLVVSLLSGAVTLLRSGGKRRF